MANKSIDISSLDIGELDELTQAIADKKKALAMQELEKAENYVNELRVAIGLKKRPLSKLPSSKGRKGKK